MSASDDPRPGGEGSGAKGSRRPWFLAATAAATAVTVVFATVGDGVDVPDATGPRALVVDVGHTAVWALLAAAFAIAAARGRWTPLSNRMALAAGAVYAVFLVAVFVWR